LQRIWEQALGAEGLEAAQILLTATDVADRAPYVNARNALRALFGLGAVPIVNENDATATDEITFGDNDALAAQVAVLVRARLLVLLTEVEGVYTRAPGMPGAELVGDGSRAREAELSEASALGRGGMQSKVLAAEMAAAAGIPSVIAAGVGSSVLGPIVAGDPRGTRFPAASQALPAYKLWLRVGKPVAARLHVDEGAQRAVVESGSSLLAVGSSPARAASKLVTLSSSWRRAATCSPRGLQVPRARRSPAVPVGSRRSTGTGSWSIEAGRRPSPAGESRWSRAGRASRGPRASGRPHRRGRR
jgi:glutamate 5-kinase